jgi:hypothetical protein
VRRLFKGYGDGASRGANARATERAGPTEGPGRDGLVTRADRAGGGVVVDLGLYALSAGFAAWTAVASTLAPHRAWGAVAAIGYAVAAIVAAAQLVLGRPGSTLRAPAVRAGLAVAAWVATTLVPLILQAWQRAGGRTDRAQEEVLVIEDGGGRWLETGTPYLDRSDIAALPADERLLGYMPYQPGMAAFGGPRALDPAAAWWSDARVWFALATAGVLIAALIHAGRAGAPAGHVVRALQVVTVLPLAALTLATGGDDLPVLALCLLALALAVDRPVAAGFAVGAAAALKLLAWPVAIVLAAHAATRRRASVFVAAALTLPVVTGLPAALTDPAAMVENVLAYPFGRGLVTSPAASPLPGHLIATSVPGGRAIAVTLLLLAGAAIAGWLVVRPPRTVAAAAMVCAVGLLAATLLLPATRFGYLLYPAALAVWATALARTREPVDA